MGNICLKDYFYLRNYFIYFSMQSSLLLIKVLCECENCEWIISMKVQVISIQKKLDFEVFILIFSGLLMCNTVLSPEAGHWQ